MAKDSFVFYKAWNPLIIAMDDVNAGRLFKSICQYQDTGEIEVDDCNAPVFEMMRRMFAKDEEKYNSKLKKLSAAGKKSHSNVNKSNQMITNDNLDGFNASDMKCNDMSCNEMQCDDNDMSCNEISYAEVSEEFNSVCVTLPKVKNMNDQRRKSIKARIKEYGRDQVSEVFRKAAESDFLSGRNKEWTNCSFDWLMKPSNFVKVLEGNYDNDVSGFEREDDNYY